MRFILLLITLAFPQVSTGTDTEFLLCRTGENDCEYATCFSRQCTIKYSDDTVYSETEYDNLKKHISERFEYIRKINQDYNKSQTSASVSGFKKSYPNFMTVILAFTGKKNNKYERVFCNLACEMKDGKYIFHSETNLSKFVVFYSHCNSGINNDDENIKLLKLGDLEEEEEANKEIIERVISSKAPSHTEPLSIAAILSLKPDTFKEMLSEKYELNYYEIHFISYLDACMDCPKILYENIPFIKQRFKNDNLFMFFHAQSHYESKNIIPYTLKFKDKEKWHYLAAKMGTYQYIYIAKDKSPAKYSQKYNLRKNCSLTKIPDFYFSIIYDLESENPQIENAARKIMFEH